MCRRAQARDTTQYKRPDNWANTNNGPPHSTAIMGVSSASLSMAAFCAGDSGVRPGLVLGFVLGWASWPPFAAGAAAELPLAIAPFAVGNASAGALAAASALALCAVMKCSACSAAMHPARRDMHAREAAACCKQRQYLGYQLENFAVAPAAIHSTLQQALCYSGRLMWYCQHTSNKGVKAQ